ncbi:isochorismatase family protein [Marinobacter sp. X15-166B]|uniref:isochorismatase family protein n=1 Tax=Marinobacter sp. X15-166B TaxID=1897620 RepID=UPI00085CA074|nr:isochorismatase family protein [Marinobacter sp. X15-166B]OEY67666.1 nicotinamidase [Marinobacter sp. X15-166B]
MTAIASFDVDAQKGFTPVCPDELPVPEGDQIVDELNAQAALADFRIGSRDAHPANAHWIANHPDEVFSEVEGDNVDIKWPPHALVGTTGFELLDGLPHPVTGYHLMVSKGLDPDCHPYGACYHDLGDRVSTGVIEFLNHHQVGTVILGGLAMDYCVAKTALQLRAAGFRVILNRAATRGIAPDSMAAAEHQMKQSGVELAASAEEVRQLIA